MYVPRLRFLGRKEVEKTPKSWPGGRFGMVEVLICKNGCVELKMSMGVEMGGGVGFGMSCVGGVPSCGFRSLVALGGLKFGGIWCGGSWV